MLIKATRVNRLEIGPSNVMDTSGAASLSVQGQRFGYTQKENMKQELLTLKKPRNS